MRTYLRRAVEAIGENKLGFTSKTVGTHSIRTSFAMLLTIMDTPDSLIMKKGRWKSNAFLRYIRSQSQLYGRNVSNSMVSGDNEFSYVIPHFNQLKIEEH